LEHAGGENDHPATRAWYRLRSEAPPPTAVETLKSKGHSSVYRLHGVGPAGAPIIAKRSHRTTVMVERVVYEEILPTLPLPALHCYGGVEEEDGAGAWLFLEDAGGRPYLEERAGDRVLAAEWLGVMHAATSRLDLAARFPPVELDSYLGYLRLTRAHVEDHLARGGLHRQRRSVFERIIGHLDGLERRWRSVDALWSRMPRCLVHRDFISANVRVRGDAGGSTLYVMDWGRAGWGVPAKDIAGLDVDTYWCRVRGCWSEFGRATIQTMAALGDVLRYLDWMEATSQYLASPLSSWVEDSEGDLVLYEGLLARARVTAGLV